MNSRTHARAPGSNRETVRRDHPGGRSATRSSCAADPRRGSLWSRSGAANGGGRADQIDLRADPRRGRYRLVRRIPAREDHARRRWRKAAAAGLSPAAVAAVVRMAGSGESAGLLHDERAREDVPIVIRLPRDDRSLEAVQSIRLRGIRPVAVGELTRAVTTQEGASLYHKNLQAVTYVTGDLAGRNGSPVYAPADERADRATVAA